MGKESNAMNSRGLEKQGFINRHGRFLTAAIIALAFPALLSGCGTAGPLDHPWFLCVPGRHDGRVYMVCQPVIPGDEVGE
jgi:hypothetical protein